MRDGLHLKFSEFINLSEFPRTAVKFVATRFAFRKFTAKAAK
ncbi:hypothetical protein [Campylobacter rectus]